MSFLQKFKQFAMKGSVVDLAVGVIVGAAFGKIVSSLVDNIVMPPLGLLIGGVHFTQLRLVLKAAGADGKGEVAIGFGSFMQDTIDFFIVAFALFIFIQMLSKVKRPPASAATPPPPEDVLLLREIRDLLKSKSSKT